MGKIDLINEINNTHISREKTSNTRMPTKKKDIGGSKTKKVTARQNTQRNRKKKVGDTSVLLRLDIDPQKLKEIRNMNVQSEEIDDGIECADDMFGNDIPKDPRCGRCMKHEKNITLLKGQLEKYKNQRTGSEDKIVYYDKVKIASYEDQSKVLFEKTNIRCQWDHNKFDNIPFYLPEMYQNGVYYVRDGTPFCSPNCAMAHNIYILRDRKVSQRQSLIYNLYRELYGILPSINVEISIASPIRMLKCNGGGWTINKFRSNFIILNKNFIIYYPPMRVDNVIVEEINIEQENTLNKKKYALKRHTPQTKKGSVISSMQTK
jgi:hypothetical protein